MPNERMIWWNDDIFEGAKVAHLVVGRLDKTIDVSGALTPATPIAIQTGPAVIVNIALAYIAHIMLRQIAFHPKVRLITNDRFAHFVPAHVDRFALAFEHFVGRLDAECVGANAACFTVEAAGR